MSQGVIPIAATAELVVSCWDKHSLPLTFNYAQFTLWPQLSRPEKEALSGNLPKEMGPPTHLHL